MTALPKKNNIKCAVMVHKCILFSKTYVLWLVSVRRIGGDHYCDERRIPIDQTQSRSFRGVTVSPLFRGRSRVVRTRRILLFQFTRPLRRRIFYAHCCTVRDYCSFVDLRCDYIFLIRYNVYHSIFCRFMQTIKSIRQKRICTRNGSFVKINK